MIGPKANSIEIVYPKTTPAKINASSTFFIGSAAPNEKFKINEIEVQANEIGAFAQVVPLNYGINNFKFITLQQSYPPKNETAKTEDSITKSALPEIQNSTNFIIERPQPSSTPAKIPDLIEYPTNITMTVKADNTPLRSTPVDGGINRLSHLYQNTIVQVNGEKGGFYRIYLNGNVNGWIRKSDLEQKEVKNPKITLKTFKTKEKGDFCLYEFKLTAKAPFSINDQKGLKVTLYNIEGQENNICEIDLPLEKLVGYETLWEENTFIIKIRKPFIILPQNPLTDLKIAIDAGHGGTEAGAIGCLGDKEKDINLSIAQNLQRELEQRGAKTVMTRKDDSTVSLQERIRIAKDENAAILISIHANALPDGKDPIKNRGTSVYYYHNQAKPLAENVLNTITSQLGTNNDNVRRGSLALVRPTSSVSILIEVGYMINPEDYKFLTDETFRLNCAKAIADGISKYILSLSTNPSTLVPEANYPQQNDCEASKKDEK